MHVITHGNSVVTVVFGDRRDDSVARAIESLMRRIDKGGLPGVIDVVPALTSVTVVIDPDVTPLSATINQLGIVTAEAANGELTLGPVQEIPITYEPGFATDLEAIALMTELTTDEVMSLHHSTEYRVAMIGFLPGFPYLEGLPTVLSIPRRATPRQRIHGGSVAIGGEFCGIYPFDSPGGWWVLGWTPVRLFDATSETPSKLAVGDRVRFVPM